MNPIQEVKIKLEKYPHIKYEESNNAISILPNDESGFEVQLEKTPSGYTVAFEGWHEIFEDAEEALNCLSFGLSDACRLKVTYRGASPQKWEVQAKEENNGTWFTDSETGLVLFPFWRKPTVTYKQNTLIKAKT